MNSNLLNQIGLGSIDYGIVIIVLLVVCIVSIILAINSTMNMKRMKTRIDSFMKGKTVKSLEETIVKIENDNSQIISYIEQNKKDIRKIFKNLDVTYQKVGLVRYDAFKESGGQLSFSMCMLNDKNSGIMLNSIFNKNGCYIYGKEITNGTSKINLSGEEQKALEIAMQGGGQN